MQKAKINVYPNQAMHSPAEVKRTEQSEDYNFVEFSEIAEYRNVNQQLLTTALKFLPKNIKNLVHVDNATGTGLIPQLAAKLYHDMGIQSSIFGIDPDLYALRKAAESMKDIDYINLQLFQGYGQHLEDLLKGHIPPEGVDIVSIHDAIHEIPGRDIKSAIFVSQAKILKPGGVQTYNSSFTTIGNGDSALKWGKWKMESFAFFNERRNKDITAMEVLSPQEYKKMITDSGLKIVHEETKSVILSLNALRAISRYPEYINGIFRDMENTEKYTLLEKSKALITILEKEGVQQLPRLWHEVVAQKPL